MLVQRPPMGYNTWNTFGGSISDSLIRETADAFVENGLKDAGYEYLVIDDCWSKRERDPETGKIVPDPEKFPNGMKAVSDYVHSKGLKFGMYSCAGVRTCADFPGSFDHEFLDAKTFAEYGCDFLKYDYCYKPTTVPGDLLYRRMGLALRKSGRDILFSACNWGCEDSGRWMRATGAHMYRSTGDIFDNFESFKNIALGQAPNLCYSAPGCFNDMDMLTVGMYGKGNVGTSGCDDNDYKTQFSLWCLFGVPLMLGCDIRNMTPETKALVTNRELIKINQDPECRGVMEVCCHPWDTEKKKVYMRHLDGGEYAFGFFNMSEDDGNVPLYLFNAGLGGGSGMGLVLTDVFTGEKTGVIKDYYSPFLKAHGCAVYRAKIVEL